MISRRRRARWRSAARLARRELRRRPARSALVIVLVALPVAGVAAADIWWRTTATNEDLWWMREIGRADDRVGASEAGIELDRPEARETVRAAYPAGSRIVDVMGSPDAVETDGGLQYVQVTDHPLEEPLLAGMLRMTSGRAPRRSGEAAVSRHVLDAADAEIGDTVELLLSGRRTITGVVQDPADYDRALVVSPDEPARHPDTYWSAFVDTPTDHPAVDIALLDRHQVVRYFRYGVPTVSDDIPYFQNERTRNVVVGTYVVGGLVLVIAAIVASAAFAVGARHQLRTLGLLSASGAGPGDLRRAVLLQGMTAGVVGSALGLAVAVGGWALVHPLLDDIQNHEVAALSVQPLDLAVAFVLGVVAATAAAWVPARTASRMPALAALAGRRPMGRVPAGMPLAGSAAIVAGLAMLAQYAQDGDRRAWVGLSGSLLVLFGTIALLPWLVARTERIGARLRGGARVAVRDLGRQRLRSVAVMAALLGPAGLAVHSATNTAIDDAAAEQLPTPVADRMELDENEVLVSGASEAELDAVRSVLPEARETPVLLVVSRPGGSLAELVTLQLSDPAFPNEPWTYYLVMADPAWLREHDFPDRVVRRLEAGSLVGFDEALSATRGFTVELEGVTTSIGRDDLVVDTESHLPNGSSVVFVSPVTVQRWGAGTYRYGSLFEAIRPLTRAQADRISDAFDGSTQLQCRSYYLDNGCDEEDLRIYLVERPASTPEGPTVSLPPDTSQGGTNDEPLVALAGFAASLVFTMLVVAVALALTAAESSGERALFEAIGASPRLRRALATWQALLLPAAAMLLAVPISLVASYILLHEEANAGFQIPWIAVGLLVVGLPLASAGITWLGASLTGRRGRDLSGLALSGD